MKTAAIIAPQFVPCSYPPSHRVRFFTNHMQDFGWQSVVLCVDAPYMEEPADEAFTAMVPEWLEIIKVKAFSPSWTRKLGIGDLGIRCYPFMLKAVRKLCRERKIDLLFIPGPPWHTFLIGTAIKKEFGIPFVMDYIDPWVSSWGENSSKLSKAYWFRQMAISLEPRAVKHVDHVVAVSKGTNDGVRDWYPFMKEDLFTAIPYGAEPADFEHVRKQPRENTYWKKEEGTFDLIYIGAMLPKAYDTLRAVFSAVLNLRKSHPEQAKRLRLRFFGTTYEANPDKGLVDPVAAEMGLSDCVIEHPARIPYLDALTLLTQTDGILALGTTEKHYTASKIFPCILAQRPLLAAYHEASSVVDILSGSGAGGLITYTDEQPVGTKVDLITDRLFQLLEGKVNAPRLEMDRFEPYTARTMSKQLTEVFDHVAAAQ